MPTARIFYGLTLLSNQHQAKPLNLSSSFARSGTGIESQ
jgi:hypothetical protein